MSVNNCVNHLYTISLLSRRALWKQDFAYRRIRFSRLFDKMNSLSHFPPLPHSPPLPSDSPFPPPPRAHTRTHACTHTCPWASIMVVLASSPGSSQLRDIHNPHAQNKDNSQINASNILQFPVHLKTTLYGLTNKSLFDLHGLKPFFNHYLHDRYRV